MREHCDHTITDCDCLNDENADIPQLIMEGYAVYLARERTREEN